MTHARVASARIAMYSPFNLVMRAAASPRGCVVLLQLWIHMTNLPSHASPQSSARRRKTSDYHRDMHLVLMHLAPSARHRRNSAPARTLTVTLPCEHQ
jgi:hypothetical protein